MSYYGYPPYVPVAQKRAKAARQLAALRKKNPDIQPVIIEGRTIASSWWGKSWNQNLERYADYRNRIGRGRSYVQHGAVLDLRIEPGKIRALVQGSQAKPYKVEITIKALDQGAWERIRAAAGGQLDSLAELLAGKFPKSLQELFFAKDEGLFPRPKEIHFDCSCPDWASMCKHVAATLYGVGARLDEKPNLFFELRQIEVDELITQVVQGTTRTLLKKAEAKSARVMEEADLSDVFGIKLDDEVEVGKGEKKKSGEQTARTRFTGESGEQEKPGAAESAGGQAGGRKRTGKIAAGTGKDGKRAARVAKKAASRRESAAEVAVSGRRFSVQAAAERRESPVKKVATGRRSSVKSGTRRTPGAQAAAAGETLVDQVVAAVPVGQSADVAAICARIGLSKIQVRNAVTRAVAQGKLRKQGRGLYGRAE